MTRGLVLSALVFMLVVQFSWSQVPQTISYQGVLTDASGTPLDGDYDLTFKLYESSVGGPELWTETHLSTSIVEGMFNVILGSSVLKGSLTLPFDKPYWLGITVGAGPELMPRIQITSAAYSLNARSAMDAWKLTGNAGIDPTVNFLGTTDNKALELRVNNLRSLLLEPHAISPNLVGGFSDNWMTSGVYGVAIGGGGSSALPNRATDSYGTVSGGGNNQAGDDAGTTEDAQYATVSGGKGNQATNSRATVGGGLSNTASGNASTIAGGGFNEATDVYCTVSGGGSNDAMSEGSTIGGGFSNEANGIYTTIGGGGSNIVASDSEFATIGGGSLNIVNGKYATISGGEENRAHADYATIGGGGSSDPGSIGTGNRVTDSYGTVSGGGNNQAGDDVGTTEDAQYATVSGGKGNQATGEYSTIPGDASNRARGDYSFAAGRRAKIYGNGSFMWADSTDADFYRTNSNRFYVRASNGVFLYTSGDLASGAYLGAGGTSWNTLSDRASKRNIRQVDVKEVLSKLTEIPISRWSYRTQDPGIEHIGPMAQDFYAAFGLGVDDKHINTIDPDGVALAAIQGLYELVKEKDAKIADLEERLKALEVITMNR